MYCVSAWQFSLLWKFSDPLCGGVVCAAVVWMHCNGKMFQITCCHAEIYIFESGAGISNKGLDKSLRMVFCF